MPIKRTPVAKSIGTYLTGRLLYMTFGALVWALHFTLIYGIHTLACAHGYTTNLVFGITLPTFAVFAVTLIALGAIAAGSYLLNTKQRQSSEEVHEERTFERRVMHWLVLLAAFGILWAGIAAVFVSPCVALR